jgi:hypothetical protein
MGSISGGFNVKTVVYCRVTGEVGIQRISTSEENAEFHTNYAVDILDPVYLTKVKTVPGFGESEHDWISLPHADTRVQFVNLFYILEEGVADWEISINSETPSEVMGQEIRNPHAVFKLIKGLFIK